MPSARVQPEEDTCTSSSWSGRKWEVDNRLKGTWTFRTKERVQCLCEGGGSCPLEDPVKQKGGNAINGLHSNWVGNDILAMARPWQISIVKYGLVDAFVRNNIGMILNLQELGEHHNCGPGNLPCSGFSYDPDVFMAERIGFYNFSWRDMGVPDLDRMMDIVQVMDYVVAIEQRRIAVHCHAGLGRTGLVIACFFVFTGRFSAADAVTFVRQQRPGSVQTSEQVLFVSVFELYLAYLRNAFVMDQGPEIVPAAHASATPAPFNQEEEHQHNKSYTQTLPSGLTVVKPAAPAAQSLRNPLRNVASGVAESSPHFALPWNEDLQIVPNKFSPQARPSPPRNYAEALQRQKRLMHGVRRRTYMHLHVFVKEAVFSVIKATRAGTLGIQDSVGVPRPGPCAEGEESASQLGIAGHSRSSSASSGDKGDNDEETSAVERPGKTAQPALTSTAGDSHSRMPSVSSGGNQGSGRQASAAKDSDKTARPALTSSAGSTLGHPPSASSGSKSSSEEEAPVVHNLGHASLPPRAASAGAKGSEPPTPRSPPRSFPPQSLRAASAQPSRQHVPSQSGSVASVMQSLVCGNGLHERSRQPSFGQALNNIKRAANTGNFEPLASAPLDVALCCLEDFFAGFDDTMPSLTVETLTWMLKSYTALALDDPKGVNEGPKLAAAAHALSPLPPADQELLLLMVSMLRHTANASHPGCEQQMADLTGWVARLLLGAHMARHGSAVSSLKTYLWYMLRNDAVYAAAILVRKQRYERIPKGVGRHSAQSASALGSSHARGSPDRAESSSLASTSIASAATTLAAYNPYLHSPSAAQLLKPSASMLKRSKLPRIGSMDPPAGDARASPASKATMLSALNVAPGGLPGSKAVIPSLPLPPPRIITA